LLRSNLEAALLDEIKEISDELETILNICKQQQGIMKEFKKNVEQILEPLDGTVDVTVYTSAKGRDRHDENPNNNREQYRGFKTAAQDLLSKMQDRIQTLQDLKTRALSVSNGVSCPHFCHQPGQDV
jgi:ElaB/YqjD/DUF883 family membrane-anchored ribosome-binding protein